MKPVTPSQPIDMLATDADAATWTDLAPIYSKDHQIVLEIKREGQIGYPDSEGSTGTVEVCYDSNTLDFCH